MLIYVCIVLNLYFIIYALPENEIITGTLTILLLPHLLSLLWGNSKHTYPSLKCRWQQIFEKSDVERSSRTFNTSHNGPGKKIFS